MLSAAVYYTINRLKKLNYPYKSRALVQKIIYLSLPSQQRIKHYRPYMWGPYSDGVQIYIIDYHTHRAYESKSPDPVIRDRINTVISLLKKRKSKAAPYSILLSMIHYISVVKNISEVREIKKFARVMGWTCLSRLPSRKILMLREKALEIEKSLERVAA